MVKDTGPWLKTLEKPVVTAGVFAVSTGLHENSRQAIISRRVNAVRILFGKFKRFILLATK